MTNTAVLERPAMPAPNGGSVLDDVKTIADGPLRAAVTRIDKGQYPLGIMAELGRAGALGAHLERGGRNTGLAISAMQAASRVCGATGFLMWAHDVCGLYLEQSGNPVLTGDLLTRHASGDSFGGTALSNPMKALSGIEPMLFRAVKVPGGYRVSGQLPWVSHIGPGQYCGAIAGVADSDGHQTHEIMFLLRCDGRAKLRACPAFSGMEGTSTFGIELEDFFVGEDDLIADPAKPFIARIKAMFILLQTGMALGVIQGSLDSMWQAEKRLGHVNKFLDERPDELQGEFDGLSARISRLAETPFDGSRDYLIAVLEERAHGGDLALRASQSALLHQGARGYLMAAAPQRRIREAHFVAIVTPAIKHLRYEIDRLKRETHAA